LKLVNQYIIPFSGLKDGFHEFLFEFGKKFFEEYPELEVFDGEVMAKVLFEKKTTMLNLEVAIQGTLQVRCDRCLEYFNLPVKQISHLVVKFGTDTSIVTDEIWILQREAYELDLKQYLYEGIGLCIPIKKVHPEDKDGKPGCDEDMLRLLDSHKTTEPDDQEMDPRWNKLKNFLNTNNN